MACSHLRLSTLSSLPYSLCFCAALNFCAAQNNDVLCHGGDGKFTADFHHAAQVHVGATKNDGLATRSCEATLSSEGQQVMVASGALEVDLDVFGADLGMGMPVAAFQVRKSPTDCCVEYSIYSLQKPPRLLRTLTGGSSFQASDIDLDSRVEIWTDDAAAVEGFDNLSLFDLNSPPPVVVRFEHNQLLDAGLEFQAYFDQRIAKLKEQVDPRDLKEFKSSDGKLAAAPSSYSPETMHRLRKAKIGILEIVWLYLNSAREREAWSTLADMWPAADVERVHTALVQARGRGIHKQIDGVVAAGHKRTRATIYDVTMSQGDESQVSSPRPILLWRPPPASEQVVTNAEISLDLIIDSAGKVRSATGARSIDPDLINAALQWKFIPASNGKRAVASRTHMAVSLRR